jgi:hypothetical protein
MEQAGYLDDLIKEYFLFRGYVSAYTAFSNDQQSDFTEKTEVSRISGMVMQSVQSLDYSSFAKIWYGWWYREDRERVCACVMYSFY